MDVWNVVREERLDLASRVSNLTSQQWDSPSLCSEWRIRDVFGHVTAGALGLYSVGPLFSGMVRHGFNFNRWMAADGKVRGTQDPASTRKALEDAAGARKTPPGVPGVGLLADVMIHAQDIYRPLGIKGDIAESHLRLAADFLVKASGFGTKKRIAGLRLAATDVDWTHGQGPDVTGPAASLVMVMAGRRHGLDDLSGEGKAVLAARFQP
jgi:uncharacterized protein (TIGR03083 family)